MAVPIAFQPGVYPWDQMGQKHPLTRPDLPPGAADWTEDNDGVAVHLNFICPCGCTKVRTVPVHMGAIGYGWAWDGNRERPTLSPSILFPKDRGECGWHGFLVKGIFNDAQG